MIDGVVCLCSRGLVHSRTMESIDRNLRDIRNLDAYRFWEVEFTHDKPIPDAQNAVVEQALRWGPQYLWFVEEDNVVPDGLLQTMVSQSQGTRAVVADYPLTNGMRCLRRAHNGDIMFAGMGCLLVPATVFSLIPKPWFHTREAYWDEHTGKIEARPDLATYGGQDVQLFIALKNAGVPIVQAEKDCQHLRVTDDRAPRTNDGAFRIQELL